MQLDSSPYFVVNIMSTIPAQLCTFRIKSTQTRHTHVLLTIWPHKNSRIDEIPQRSVAVPSAAGRSAHALPGRDTMPTSQGRVTQSIHLLPAVSLPRQACSAAGAETAKAGRWNSTAGRPWTGPSPSRAGRRRPGPQTAGRGRRRKTCHAPRRVPWSARASATAVADRAGGRRSTSEPLL